jgi:hypothetical protein
VDDGYLVSVTVGQHHRRVLAPRSALLATHACAGAASRPTDASMRQQTDSPHSNPEIACWWDEKGWTVIRGRISMVPI